MGSGEGAEGLEVGGGGAVDETQGAIAADEGGSPAEAIGEIGPGVVDDEGVAAADIEAAGGPAGGHGAGPGEGHGAAAAEEAQSAAGEGRQNGGDVEGA